MDRVVEGIVIHEKRVGEYYFLTSPDVPGFSIAHLDRAEAYADIRPMMEAMKRVSDRIPSIKLEKEAEKRCARDGRRKKHRARDALRKRRNRASRPSVRRRSRINLGKPVDHRRSRNRAAALRDKSIPG